jgi:phosphate:Na+ symporter
VPRRPRRIGCFPAQAPRQEARVFERHPGRLRSGKIESLETSSFRLDVLRDLKRINSHLTSVAYTNLETAGALTDSRLKQEA